ncbi:MAG TPA: hypothetical protein VKH65_06935, partial [Myxococcales bacterium]|nr:hypothetical protein [Myxococcales bacterium]
MLLRALLLPRIGPFRTRAILPLGALAARPLVPGWAGVAVLAVRALRPLAAVIAPASLARVLAVAAPAETVAVAEFRPGRLRVALRRCRRLSDRRSGTVALEPTEDAAHEARMTFGRARRLGSGLLRAHRRRPFRRDALHGRLLARRPRFLRGWFLG